MLGVPTEMAGVAERAHQRNLAMDAGGDAEKVIMGEVTDDDLDFRGELLDGPQIGCDPKRCTLFDEAGRAPINAVQPLFEISPSGEEQARIDRRSTQSATAQLCHRARSGVLVGCNYDADPHDERIADRYVSPQCRCRLR